MRTLTQEMMDAIRSRTVNLVYCVKIEMPNGNIIALNNGQKDLLIDGITYKYSESINKTAITFNERLTPDNIDIDGLIKEEQILSDEIVSGTFSGSNIDIFLVDSKNISNGKIVLSKYYITDVEYQRGKYTLKLKGQSAKYKQTYGATYSSSCWLTYGSAECGAQDVTIEDNQTVTQEFDSKRLFKVDALSGYAQNFFANGTVEFLSGKNKGITMRILTSDAGLFKLKLKAPFKIQLNDTVKIMNGCGKLKANCIEHNNVINYRGYDEIPGDDAIRRRV